MDSDSTLPVYHQDLKRRSLRAGLIVFAAQPIKLTIGIGTTALLARLLTPADFGLLAMLTPLLFLVDSLTNLGMETVVIQQETLDHQQISGLFGLSLKVNAVVLALMVAVAPVLAWFYQESELVGMIFALAFGVLCLCLSFPSTSLLKQHMQFGTLTIVEVISLAVGAVSALIAAWSGLSYWVLVIQVVIVQFTQSIACWIVYPWQPNSYSQAAQAKIDLSQSISYGSHLSAYRFLTRIGMFLDRVLIGYFGNAATLGLYYMAYQWAFFPFEQIYGAVFNVAVSSLSRAYSEPNLYRAYCRQGFLLFFSLCLPMLAFSFVEARSLLLFLLGRQWLEAVPIFRVLVFAVFVVSSYRVTKWLYVSSGETQRQLRWGLIHPSVMILGVSLGARWGVYGVAVGYAIATCLLSYPSVIYCLKTLPLTTGDFIESVGRPTLASIFAAIILFFSQPIFVDLDLLFLALLAQSFFYSLFYLSIWLLLPSGIQEAVNILNNFQFLRSKSS